MRLSFRPFALLLSTTTTVTSASASTSFGALHRSSTAFVSSFGRSNRSALSTSTTLRMASSSSTAATDTSDDKLRVALCQFHVTPDKETNHATATDYVGRAAAQGAQLVVLPEIWNSPYATSAFPEYAETLPKVGDDQCPKEHAPSSTLLMALSKQHQLFIVGGSIPENDNDKVYNTCLVYDPTGKVVAKHRKVHLFDINVPGGISFFESDTLSPGDALTTFPLSPDDPNSCHVGVGICYDIRFALQAMLMCQSQPNCKLLIYPGAFNMTTGPAHWELLQRGRAIDNQCYVLTASPARTEAPNEEEEGKYPHYTAWGHSTIVSPWGEVVMKADETESLVVCDLDLGRVDEVRTSIPIGKQQRTDLYKLEDVTRS